MKKSDIFKAILGAAVGFVPGGDRVKGGIEKILEAKHDDDDEDDFDEIAAGVAMIAVGAVTGTEALTDKDIVNDPILAQLVENIEGDLKLAKLLKAKPPVVPLGPI